MALGPVRIELCVVSGGINCSHTRIATHGEVGGRTADSDPHQFQDTCGTVHAVIMRPSSLGGGRILRRTLSVCLSVRPVIITERHVAPPSELQ